MATTGSTARSLRPAPRADHAVLLNANAKRVRGRVRDELERAVPAQHLFLSRTEAEARGIAQTVVERGYGTVFAGGGDGTLVRWIDLVGEEARRQGRRPPRFGVLALGTGNAVGAAVGARPGAHVEQLASFASGAAPRTMRLELLACAGRRTPFAGVGVDAAVVNDYEWLRGALRGSPVAAAASGLPGYALSIALRSAPRQVARRPVACEIVNAGGRAWRLDGGGRRVGPGLAPGDVLYAGPCMMAAASTVPFYGFGLRAFPFADRERGRFQLRVATRIGVASLLLGLGRVWSGEFRHVGLLDWHAEAVTVRFERPVPLQVAGDAEGWRDEVTFAMSGAPVEVVDFRPAPPRPRLVS